MQENEAGKFSLDWEGRIPALRSPPSSIFDTKLQSNYLSFDFYRRTEQTILAPSIRSRSYKFTSTAIITMYSLFETPRDHQQDVHRSLSPPPPRRTAPRAVYDWDVPKRTKYPAGTTPALDSCSETSSDSDSSNDEEEGNDVFVKPWDLGLVDTFPALPPSSAFDEEERRATRHQILPGIPLPLPSSLRLRPRVKLTGCSIPPVSPRRPSLPGFSAPSVIDLGCFHHEDESSNNKRRRLVED